MSGRTSREGGLKPTPRKPVVSPELPLDAAASPAEAQKILHDLLETLWEQRKGSVVDRLQTLQKAVSTLDHSPTPKSRETGIDAAHKLAGILGTFGLPRGTDLAREVEVAMSREGSMPPEAVAHMQQVVDELATLIAQRALPTTR